MIHSQVGSVIWSQLNDFAASSSIPKSSKIFANKVHSIGAATIILPFYGHGLTQRTPCDQFRLMGARYPGIVVDVGSQGPSEIHRRAKQYIFSSNGEIQKVIYISVIDGKGFLTIWSSQLTTRPHRKEELQCIATVNNLVRIAGHRIKKY